MDEILCITFFDDMYQTEATTEDRISGMTHSIKRLMRSCLTSKSHSQRL